MVSAMLETLKVRELLEGNATSRISVISDEELEVEIAAEREAIGEREHHLLNIINYNIRRFVPRL